jgi:hypothetical protein
MSPSCASPPLSVVETGESRTPHLNASGYCRLDLPMLAIRGPPSTHADKTAASIFTGPAEPVLMDSSLYFFFAVFVPMK